LKKIFVILGLIILFYALYNVLTILAVVSAFLVAMQSIYQTIEPLVGLLGVELPAIPSLGEVYMYLFMALAGAFLIGYGVGAR